ncbi:hypothetical protein OAM90_03875 [Flavobacteriaceae bacterium]|nr:hypothetical protein [Flavobacteriaceae bacterium]
MKKLLLFTALASFTFASAQVTTNAGTFNKPAEGDTAFEMQFMPNLDGAAMFADRGATVTMRKFESAEKAVRWSASLDYGNDGDRLTPSNYSLGLGYGIENHFAGAERLSTYWGYGASMTYTGESDYEVDVFGLVEDEDGNPVIDPNTGDQLTEVIRVDDVEGADGVFTLGAGVFLGADYYIMPKVYVGVEIGYGLDVNLEDNTSMTLGGGVNGMMRFGFRL